MKFLLSIIFITYSLYGAELKYENLLQGLPKDFKVGYQAHDKKNSTTFIEFIQKKESVDDWSEMITTSIYHKNLPVTALQYTQKIADIWTKSCKDGYTKQIRDGKENGYNFALVMLYCPKSKVTNKVEFTWLKAIKGKDSFYSVQKAFTYNPTKESVIDTMQYLRRVQVCDTRLDNCPKVNK
jgi:hypothetical protein